MKICDICGNSDASQCDGCFLDFCDNHNEEWEKHEKSCPYAEHYLSLTKQEKSN